jgi:V/A-type H+-transporting ATPase subunit A
LLSYSQDSDVLADFWNQQGNPQWPEQRRRFLTLIEEQSRLERMARIVGKDALPPRQQHILLCAELINEAFLRQSAYSPIDRFCSPARQIAMMRIIINFINLSEAAVNEGVSVERINDLPVMRRIRRMGEEIAENRLDDFKELMRNMEAEFTHLSEGVISNAS